MRICDFAYCRTFRFRILQQSVDKLAFSMAILNPLCLYLIGNNIGSKKISTQLLPKKLAQLNILAEFTSGY